jgi:hypothetical protein
MDWNSRQILRDIWCTKYFRSTKYFEVLRYNLDNLVEILLLLRTSSTKFRGSIAFTLTCAVVRLHLIPVIDPTTNNRRRICGRFFKTLGAWDKLTQNCRRELQQHVQKALKWLARLHFASAGLICCGRKCGLWRGELNGQKYEFVFQVLVYDINN